MIKSMTGFGRGHDIIDGRDIVVEVRSVNHRYLEFSAKIPRAFLYLEDKIKGMVRNSSSRGKIEVGVTIYNVEGKETNVSVNPSVVEAYIKSLRELPAEFNLKDDLSLSNVFNMVDAFNVLKEDSDEEEVWNAVKSVTETALEKFLSAKETEGERLKADCLEHLDIIENLVSEIEKFSPENVEAYRNRLTERMKEVLLDKAVDEGRILLEAAIFSERTAVDEETVRLRSHLKQFREMLSSDDSVGRKLDFLVQELNRETNTIGSKAQDLRITKLVVEIKSEIEKIREQIQNIE